jgi:lipopolysaccharide export LptBFGC system permease protein LptF
MFWCRRFWRDHSLTLVAGAIGAFFFVLAIFFTRGEGTWFDIWCELMGTFVGIAGLFVLAWKLREKAKPEE